MVGAIIPAVKKFQQKALKTLQAQQKQRKLFQISSTRILPNNGR
jgi:hypothetical protein